MASCAWVGGLHTAARLQCCRERGASTSCGSLPPPPDLNACLHGLHVMRQAWVQRQDVATPCRASRLQEHAPARFRNGGGSDGKPCSRVRRRAAAADSGLARRQPAFQLLHESRQMRLLFRRGCRRRRGGRCRCHPGSQAALSAANPKRHGETHFEELEKRERMGGEAGRGRGWASEHAASPAPAS